MAIVPFVSLLDLEVQEIPHVNLWEYYRNDDIPEDEEAAWKLCDAVAAEGHGDLVIDGIDVVETLQNDLFSAFRLAITASKVIGRVLDDEQPEKVLHFGEMNDAIYWDPPDPPGDIFNAMVAWCAQKRGLPTEKIWLHEDPALHPPVVEKSSRLRTFDSDWFDRETPFLSFTEASYCAEQRELIHGRHKAAEEWLLVSSDSPETNAPYLPLSEFRSFPFDISHYEDKMQALCGRFPKAIASGQPECIVANEYLSFIWDSWMGWLREGVVNVYLGRLFGRAYRPGTTVTGSDVAGAARAFAAGIRQTSGAVISLDHWGTKLEATHDRQRGASNHAAVSGSYELVGHEENRCAEAQVRAIGTLRADISLPAKKSESRRKSSHDQIKIAVFTAQGLIHGNLFACANYKPFRDTWEKFLGLCRDHPEWSVEIKPHPAYDYGPFYESRPFLETPNVRYTPNATIDDVLAGADMALIMNIHTWVLPEIISRGCPVIYVKDALALGPVPQMDDGGAINVDDISQLDSVIDRLARDAAYRDEVLEEARLFLPRAVEASGKEAMNNLIEFSRDVRKDAGDPDEAARWIMNMTMLIAYLRYGEMPWREFESHLRMMRRRGKDIDFTQLVDVELGLVGPYLLHFLMREPVVWPCSRSFPPRAAWQVYFAIPRILRPDNGLLRSCATLAYRHALDSSRSMLARLYYVLSGAVFAPGNLLKRGA